MFGLFKKKTEKEKLTHLYNKKKTSFMSKSNRKESDKTRKRGL